MNLSKKKSLKNKCSGYRMYNIYYMHFNIFTSYLHRDRKRNNKKGN